MSKSFSFVHIPDMFLWDVRSIFESSDVLSGSKASFAYMPALEYLKQAVIFLPALQHLKLLHYTSLLGLRSSMIRRIVWRL